MTTALKLLSALCWIASALLLVSYYYFPYNPEPVQALWDYAIDPVIMSTLILVITANVMISLKIHDAGRGLPHLPMDVLTLLGAFFSILYVHQYVLKFAEGFEPSQFLWDLLVPGVVIFMIVSAISYQRQAKSNPRDTQP